MFGWLSKKSGNVASKADGRASVMRGANSGRHGSGRPSEARSSMLSAMSQEQLIKVRERLGVAVKQALTRNNIPGQNLSFELKMVNTNHGPQIQVQITMVRWNERLFLYAHAIEREIMRSIEETDVNLVESIRGVFWRVAPNAQCPITDLPPPSEWAPKVDPVAQAAARIAAQQSKSDPKADLNSWLDRQQAARSVVIEPGRSFAPTQNEPAAKV